MSAPIDTATIANEAIDQLQVAREYMAWMDSLSWALNQSLKSGHHHHAKQLAGVVGYLAGDYSNAIDCDITRLSDQLAEADLRT
ncbi:hypothetical protein ACKUFS_20870 [Pseudomonas cannabina]|uniref:Uncharacterized protein n=3 Tax=Pseudomonas syringae group TaxID=136849 RepID=A0A3M3Q9W4_PSECA|nr:MULTISPECIES: hypothetical protein [Pseudomonas syringae group]KPB72509.1 Uncharacterized protein AC507_2506 [Pseudomonas syringae pv. maculicola]KPW22629.1 hypothetical protein ALO83_103272 [Pseudomonas cannabina pv. alisalensis]MBM0141284.1 hypothetical protein [Pseudomonas cannabina pv. alisalensis]QHE99771.1 hypothetical protein PMA4326_026250 [Pseudomonas syringae pv. maculicola str. ES4326]QQN21806.1 hypothetical protein JGS08_25185 [Pseudomonas cannabina pv. alisalensis]